MRLPRVRLTILLALATGCSGSGKSTSHDGQRGFTSEGLHSVTVGPSPEAIREGEVGFKLVLVPLGEQRRDHLAFRVEVVNTGNTPFDWDREFSAGLIWDVNSSEGSGLEPSSIGSHPDSLSSNLKGRFVTITPGQTLSKEFVITERVPIFTSRVMHYRDGHRNLGDEELECFRIPDSTTGVTIRLRYFSSRALGGVANRFKVAVSDLRLPRLSRNVASNYINIIFK
jgi:hypothetical protein